MIKDSEKLGFIKDGKTLYSVENGNKIMCKVTGTGTLKVKILDAIYNLSEAEIMERSKINEE